MTGEEMERAIEFLLKSQAAFEARQAAFEARQEAFEASQVAFSAKQDRTQEHLDQLTRVVASIAEVTQRNSEEIDVLVKLVGGIIERGNGKPE